MSARAIAMVAFAVLASTTLLPADALGQECFGSLRMSNWRVVSDRFSNEAQVTWEIRVSDPSRRGARYVVSWRYDVHYSYRERATGDREETTSSNFERVPGLRGPGSQRSRTTVGLRGPDFGTNFRIEEVEFYDVECSCDLSYGLGSCDP